MSEKLYELMLEELFYTTVLLRYRDMYRNQKKGKET
jgi:hypothetical protein